MLGVHINHLNRKHDIWKRILYTSSVGLSNNIIQYTLCITNKCMNPIHDLILLTAPYLWSHVSNVWPVDFLPKYIVNTFFVRFQFCRSNLQARHIPA